MDQKLEYNFSQDWFSGNIPVWQQHFSQLAQRPTRYLEIGVFEGRSAMWAVENLLKHPDSSAVFVDTFKGSQEHNMDQLIPEGEETPLLRTFKGNVAACTAKTGFSKYEIVAGGSFEVLARFCGQQRLFDLIYVDGSHQAKHVLEDAMLAFRALDSDGFMVLDDYGWNIFPDPHLCPKLGIDKFLEIFGRDLRVLHVGYQVIIQKF